jgi:hypothetical protein
MSKNMRWLQCDGSALDGFVPDASGIDARAIVGDFEGHLSAFVQSVKRQHSLGGLAEFDPPFGEFDAVIHGVSHKMGEKIVDGFEQGAVEFGVFPSVSIRTCLPQATLTSRTTRGTLPKGIRRKTTGFL